MKKRTICEVLLGLLVLAATFVTYAGHFDCIAEYCFMSGAVTGGVFAASAIYRIKSGKSLPEWIYLDCSAATMIILLATITLHLNLDGGFIFIHVINPLLMFAYWAYFCDHRHIKNKAILTVLVFPGIYTIITGLMMLCTGDCPFPVSLIYEGNTAPVIVLLHIGIYMLFIVMGYAFHFGKRAISSKLQKQIRNT